MCIQVIIVGISRKNKVRYFTPTFQFVQLTPHSLAGSLSLKQPPKHITNTYTHTHITLTIPPLTPLPPLLKPNNTPSLTPTPTPSQDVRGGRALSAIAVNETRLCKKLSINTSQLGDHSLFRNGKLGSLVVNLRGDWFNHCPSSGTLHTDYLSMTKPLAGTKGDPPGPVKIYAPPVPVIIYTLL